jgi:hypothetical protein
VPALVFGPALGSGFLQFPLGGSTLAVLGCEEDRSILADDLRFPVAEEAVSPLVPGGHAPVDVRHKDGIVLGGLHQPLEAFLALLKRYLQTPLVGLIVVRTTHTTSLSHTDCASMDYSRNVGEGEFCEVHRKVAKNTAIE